MNMIQQHEYDITEELRYKGLKFTHFRVKLSPDVRQTCSNFVTPNKNIDQLRMKVFSSNFRNKCSAICAKN